MSALIKPNTCSTCGHHFRNGNEIQCRARPPQVQGIVAMTSAGIALQGTVTLWPIVQAEHFCGEFRKLASPGAALAGASSLDLTS